MKARIAVCGSLADGVRVHERKGAGWAMTTASLAVTIQPGFVSQDNELVIDNKEKTMWFRVIAYGQFSDTLAKCYKDETVAISGSLEWLSCVDRNGELREGFGIIADSIVSASMIFSGKMRVRRNRDR